MRKVILVAWVISLLIFGVRDAACQCLCRPVPGGRDLSAHEALKTSDVVFIGEVVEVEKGAAPDEYRVKFKIKRVWKKDVGETVVLTTFRTSCGYFGEKEDVDLIYAYVREGVLTTNGCTRTKSLAKAAADLKEFEEKGEEPVKIYEAEPPAP